MPFDINIWKGKYQERLPGWKARLQQAGVNSVYGSVAAMALWPVVEAFQQGDVAPLMTLGGVLAGVGSNLLANQVQTWKDEGDAAARLTEAAEQDDALRAELDAVLERLGAIPAAELALPADERAWFVDTLQSELARLGSTVTYIATASDRSAIAQGTGAKAVSGILVEGDVGGDLIAPGGTKTITPDPRIIAAEKQADARQRYLERLSRDCQSLPLVELGSDPDASDDVTLNEVYITLNTTHQIPISEDEKEAYEKEQRTLARGLEREERPLTALEAAAQNPHLALLGDPGSGKSTFVRHLLAWQAGAKPEPPPGITPGLLPVFVVLRDLIPELEALDIDRLAKKKQDNALVGVVRDQILADLARLEVAEFSSNMQDALHTGACLLVLDGLDEVPQALRCKVRQAVSALCRRFPVQQIIITCRVRSYVGEAEQPGFARFTLAPFNEGQVRAFVGNWYQAQKRLGRVSALQADEKAADLAKAALDPDLRELATNPMMLTSMAIIHQKEYSLPPERVRLYKLVVDVLLQRWQKRITGEALTTNPALNKLLKDDLRLRRIMERLAYEAHKSDKGQKDDATDLPRLRALEILDEPEYIGDLNLAQAFLDYVDQRAGLLVGRGGDPSRPTSYSFPHRTFQEYLAGCYLTGHLDAARLLAEHATEPEYWSLAADLGAEEIYYNGGSIGVKNVLGLMYQLFPRYAPENPQKCRQALWAGKMAALVGGEMLVRDTLQDGEAYLEQVRTTLVELLRSDLTPPERADAGRALGKLGDPRAEVMAVDAMRFCIVPAGEFTLGSDKTRDSMAYDDEEPEHILPLPGYWIARYPVSNDQFQAFVDAGGYKDEKFWPEATRDNIWRDGQIHLEWANVIKQAATDFGEPFNLPNHPVVGVTWYESLAFTRWLTERWQANGWLPEGWRVSLPTEAQWEKTARGGMSIPVNPDALIRTISEGLSAIHDIPLQPNPDPKRVYSGEGEFDAENTNIVDTGIRSTSTPGCFPNGVSPYGVFDLSGNVWEWTCSLDYEKFPYPYKFDDGRENLDAPDDVRRVLRGGSFGSNRNLARCACRFRLNPDHWYGHLGFRVVVRTSSHSS